MLDFLSHDPLEVRLERISVGISVGVSVEIRTSIRWKSVEFPLGFPLKFPLSFPLSPCVFGVTWCFSAFSFFVFVPVSFVFLVVCSLGFVAFSAGA